MAGLQTGERLPLWTATTIQGELIGSETLHGRPFVLILARGLR